MTPKEAGERRRAGMRAAEAAGVKLGRPRTAKAALIEACLRRGWTERQIRRHCGCGWGAIQRVRQDMREQMQERGEEADPRSGPRAGLEVIVRVVGAADGTPTPHDGRYVVAWSPHTRFGICAIETTADAGLARRFRGSGEAFEEWRTVSSVQAKRAGDGLPNRPLTGLNIEVVHRLDQKAVELQDQRDAQLRKTAEFAKDEAKARKENAQGNAQCGC